MPLQNRITPFGDIVAIPQRGIFTGNRGIIHDPVTKTLLNRRWASKAWLVCLCDFGGRRRPVMGARTWTELFFLDEVVALSAGHRPCFFCRREAAEHFRDAWAAAKGGAPPLATEIDAILHRERLENGRKRVHLFSGSLSALPDGAMVLAHGSAFALHRRQAYQWANEGYGSPVRLTGIDGLLTPPSTLMALTAGYRPVFHPSINPTFGEVSHARSA